MAMVLRPTRLRLTQAIYFGQPKAGGSVSTVSGGNGIITSPNPIIGVGSVALGTLTSDHSMGNFNLDAQNTLRWYNVVAFGADNTGANAAATTAAVNAAITSCSTNGGGVVYFPHGIYLLTPNAITIAHGGVHLLGDVALATNIVAAAGVAGPIFKFAFGALTLYECGISHMNFSSLDVTTQKTMVEISDCSSFIAERIFCADGTWTGASSIGINVKGREMIRIKDCRLSTDIPIQISPNPNPPGVSFDLSSIEDCNLVVTAGLNNPSIKILDNSVLTSVVIKNTDGNAGAGLILANATTPATAWGPISIINCRTEQANDPTAYSIDLRNSAGQIQGLIVDGFSFDPTCNGMRLSNAQWPLINGVSYGGTGTFLNLSASVRGFTIQNAFTQAGSTITDASISPCAINFEYGAGTPISAIGSLTSQLPFSVLGQMMIGGVANSSGAQLDIFKNATYSNEGTADIYLRSGVGATNTGMLVGTDKANAVAYIQSTEPATSFFNKPLALNPSGGNVGINTIGATRTLDLNGTQRYRGVAAPAVSEANSGTIYFDSGTNKLMASLNGGAYVPVIGAGGVTGSGVAGSLTYWTSATNLTDEPNITLGGTYTLDVNGNINLAATNIYRIAGVSVLALDTPNGIASVATGATAGPSGIGSTAVGFGAASTATGTGLTAIGAGTLSATTGTANTAVGSSALGGTTSGTNNTAIGLSAGITNTTGTNNIFIGSTADATAGNLNHACAIGVGATIADSNALNIGGGIQKVGIATSTPKVAMDVNGAMANRQQIITLVNGLNSNITPLVQSSWLRIQGPTAGFSVGGFSIPGPASGVTDGLTLCIYNSVAFQMTIVNEDGSSTAVNRIKTLTGGNVVLRAGTSAATFRYDDTDDRWILVSQN